MVRDAPGDLKLSGISSWVVMLRGSEIVLRDRSGELYLFDQPFSAGCFPFLGGGAPRICRTHYREAIHGDELLGRVDRMVFGHTANTDPTNSEADVMPAAGHLQVGALRGAAG
jgi:hypothetical protein